MKYRDKYLTVILLLVGIICLNYLASAWSIRIDFTQDRLYTLSEGSRSLLRQIEEPVTLQFYFSRSLDGLPIALKNYATRVEEMLRQYERAARGRLLLQVIDPRPDSEEEEQAARAGLQSQSLPTGENLYFGLVAVQADEEATIPFFAPNREPFLEYDLSQLIFSVQQLSKPRLGLLTSLPLRGQPPRQPGQPPRPGQVILTEWERVFEIVEVSPSAESLPSNLDVLAVIHPIGLPDSLQYSIDQFILRGRPVFLALDPSSRHFANNSPQSGMMMGPPPNTSSDLPRLLQAYGISFVPDQVVGDLELATPVNTGRGIVNYPVWLSLRPDNLNERELPTAQLNSLLFVESGAISLREESGLSFTPLVQSSPRASKVQGMLLQFSQPQDIARQITPAQEPFTLAALVRGNFSSAFQEGPPLHSAAEDTAEDASAGSPAREHLSASTRPGTLLIVADTDWLMDDYSVQRMSFLGMTALQPLNDNLNLASNILEFLGGNEDLISIRGKGSSLRPFEVVRRLEARAQERYQAQLAELERRLADVQQRLGELSRQQAQTGQLVATPEMRETIESFRVQEAQMRSERREIRKALREDIQKLETTLLLLNLLVVPAVLGVFGFWFFRQRLARRKES